MTHEEVILDRLQKITLTHTDNLRKEAEAHTRWIQDREELRIAENTAIERRIKDRSIGTNESVRRSQIDNDCSSERQQAIEAECEYLRACAERSASEQTLLTARLIASFARPALVDQTEL